MFSLESIFEFLDNGKRMQNKSHCNDKNMNSRRNIYIPESLRLYNSIGEERRIQVFLYKTCRVASSASFRALGGALDATW
jgi:hypothetical protein